MNRDDGIKAIMQRLQAIPGLRDLQEMNEEQPIGQDAKECERMLMHDAWELLKEEIEIIG